MIYREVIKIQGRMFQIKRKFPQHKINFKKGSTSDLKIFFHCETIFKAQGLVWFADEIPTVEYKEI